MQPIPQATLNYNQANFNSIYIYRLPLTPQASQNVQTACMVRTENSHHIMQLLRYVPMSRVTHNSHPNWFTKEIRHTVKRIKTLTRFLKRKHTTINI